MFPYRQNYSRNIRKKIHNSQFSPHSDSIALEFPSAYRLHKKLIHKEQVSEGNFSTFNNCSAKSWWIFISKYTQPYAGSFEVRISDVINFVYYVHIKVSKNAKKKKKNFLGKFLLCCVVEVKKGSQSLDKVPTQEKHFLHIHKQKVSIFKPFSHLFHAQWFPENNESIIISTGIGKVFCRSFSIESHNVASSVSTHIFRRASVYVFDIIPVELLNVECRIRTHISALIPSLYSLAFAL